jgi:hypothetical protein
MSRAEEFRQHTEEFWSQMDQKRRAVATDHKAKPTSSRNTPKKISVGRADQRQKTKKRRHSD